MNGLVLVIDILVDDHFFAAVIHPLKYNRVLAGESAPVKLKSELQRAVRAFRRESDCIVFYGDRSSGLRGVLFAEVIRRLFAEVIQRLFAAFLGVLLLKCSAGECGGDLLS